MARNRKRAKDRRARRPAQGPNSRQGLPTATHEPSRALEPEDRVEPENGLEPDESIEAESRVEAEENGVPDPLEHATPDVELADAQVAYGRPERPEPGDEADEEEFELEVEESIEDETDEADYHERVPVRRGRGRTPVAETAVAERRELPGTRLIGFLQGSWRELQRVQWPDRRQVIQATGVVIGFVIVAAAFLGLADLVASKIVTFVLK